MHKIMDKIVVKYRCLIMICMAAAVLSCRVSAAEIEESTVEVYDASKIEQSTVEVYDASDIEESTVDIFDSNEFDGSNSDVPDSYDTDEDDAGLYDSYDETEEYEELTDSQSTSVDKTYEYVNPTTNYKALIEDNAGLLDDSQREKLLSEMEKITTYGNVAFHTVDANNSTAGAYASGYYHNKFNKESGTLFLIDMDNRKVYIFSDGDIYRTVTKTYANIITDNVYTYASKQDYYGCASKVFEQEYDLLEGRRIAQPMKYISNALLAVVLALLLNYILVRVYAGSKTPSRKELLNGIFVEKKLNNTQAIFTNETKRYDPVESSSGGSSGRGGGGGGGGGSSGGGGGHSF